MNKVTPNIAINHRAFGTGLKTATRFFAGYGKRQISGGNNMSVVMLKKFSQVASSDNCALRVTGIQNGSFVLMADFNNETYILGDAKNKHKEFKQIQDILRIIQINTWQKEIKLEFQNWVGT